MEMESLLGPEMVLASQKYWAQNAEYPLSPPMLLVSLSFSLIASTVALCLFLGLLAMLLLPLGWKYLSNWGW